MTNVTLTASIDDLAVNTIKFLAVDAIEKAKSGHPGLPLGAADYAYVLWIKHLRHNPDDPKWPNRDRFILSAGHGSMLLYSLLHLSGYDLPLEELKNFRQWGSLTPGHPETGHTPGVETTTGPLGQGFANGVGMAIAAKMTAARFNKPDNKIIDHFIYAIVSDGDLMEGVSHEAASLAGHLGLGNLIYLYDDNCITIEGRTCLSYSDEVEARFKGYNWHVQTIDGHDRIAADRAIEAAKAVTDKPSLIICKTRIANGAPSKANTAEAHGEPLGAQETAAMKESLGWPQEPTFFIPEEVKNLWAERKSELIEEYKAWQKQLSEYKSAYPEDAALWADMLALKTPDNLTEQLLESVNGIEDEATRNSSGIVMQTLAKLVPSLVGGSADLAPSTKTLIKCEGSFKKEECQGRNLHFGIREHAMGAAMNGMALYGGFIPYGSTFLVFSDYCRPAIRISALSKIPAVYVFTHDSIFVGEDGPTHEPVEHLAALRAIPNLTVIRPADAAETAVAWAAAVENKSGPTAIILSRQKIKALSQCAQDGALNLKKGAYVVTDVEGKPDALIIASGSEVRLAQDAAAILANKGMKCRVVSMPSFELFEKQDCSYKNEIIPSDGTPIISIEAGASFGWHKYVGKDGLVIGIDRFGASAPYQRLAEEFGFTPEKVTKRIEEYLKSSN